MKYARAISLFLTLLLAFTALTGAEAASKDSRPAGPTPSPQHQHRYVDWTVETEATCTEAGMSRAHCALCGATAHQKIPALGHDWGAWEDKGAYSERACSRCGMTQQSASPRAAGNTALVLTGLQSGRNVTLAVTNAGSVDLKDVNLSEIMALPDGTVLSEDETAPEGWDTLAAGQTATADLYLPDSPEAEDDGPEHTGVLALLTFTASGTPVSGNGVVSSEPWTAQLLPWAVSPAVSSGEDPCISVEMSLYGAPPKKGDGCNGIALVTNEGTEPVEIKMIKFYSTHSKYPFATIEPNEIIPAGGSREFKSAKWYTFTDADQINTYLDFHVDVEGKYAGTNKSLKNKKCTASDDYRTFIKPYHKPNTEYMFEKTDELFVKASCLDTIRYENQEITIFLTVSNRSDETLYWINTNIYHQGTNERVILDTVDYLEAGWDIYPIEHYTVTKEDLQLDEVSFELRPTAVKGSTTKTMTAEYSTLTVPVEKELSLSVTPQNEVEFNYAGQEVTFDVLVKNNGKQDLVNVKPGLGNVSTEGAPIPRDPKTFPLASGESKVVHYDYTVKPEDLAAVSQLNILFRVTGESAVNGKETQKTASTIVHIWRTDPPAPEPEPEPEPVAPPDLVLKNFTFSAPVSYAGQEIPVTITAENPNERELTDILISCDSPAAGVVYPDDYGATELAPSASDVYKFIYTVAEEDLSKDSVILKFSGAGWDDATALWGEAVYTGHIPVEIGAPASDGKASIVLSDYNYDAKADHAGQEIVLSITAQNQGENDLKSIAVTCTQTDNGTSVPADTVGSDYLTPYGSDVYTFRYTVTAEDMGKDMIHIRFDASGTDCVTDAPATDSFSGGIAVLTGECDIELTNFTYSADAAYAGQEIVVGIRADNNTWNTIDHLAVSCVQEDSGSAVPAETVGSATIGSKGTDIFTFRYTVTAEDMTGTSIPFRFDASCADSITGKPDSDTYTGHVPVKPTGTEDGGDKELSIDLIDLKASDYAKYEGQVITVSAKAYNPNPVSLKNVDVRSEDSATHTPLPVYTSGAAYLSTHADTEYSFDYTVTKEDMDKPSISIVFEAFGQEDADDVGNPVYDADILTIDVVPSTKGNQAPAVLVEKSVTNHAKAKSGKYAPYETIDFSIHITNNMPYDVAGFTVFDTLVPGTGFWTTTGPVASGASVDVYFPYSPDTVECGSGFLYNQAVVQWPESDTGMMRSAVSNVVRVELYLPDHTSPAEGLCCVRTPVSAEGGTLVWHTDVCPVHAKLMEKGCGAEAEAAWLEAISVLYDGMLVGADERTASAVRAERDAWYARHEALRKLLPLIADGETVERMLAEDAMLRCTDLCCEAHTAPAPRADLMDPAAYAPGTYDSCALHTEADGKGFTLTLGLCASHGEAGDLSALQDEAGERVRLLQRRLGLGDIALVNALKSAQADWFAARSALLNILYDADTANAILAADARMCISQICAAVSRDP